MEEKQPSAARTIGVVMLVTLIGKVLGLYRDRLLAIHYSVGMEASAFFTASRIPRVFFDAVFASAVASCFIPVFSEYLEKKGKTEAHRFACSFITLIGLVTAALSLVGMLFPSPLVALFADYRDPATVALASNLTRIMFPTVFFSGIAFSLVGVLQAQDHFLSPALMSTASNLVIIAYFLFLDRTWGIYGLAVAYLVGWFLQGLIHWPSLRAIHFRYRPRLEVRTEGMAKVLALMGPVMVSSWVQPINLVISSRFGSRLLDGGGVSVMEYSNNLYLVITGVFILSVTNVIFPRLSRLNAGGEESAFRDTLRQTIHTSLFFVLPMTAGLMAVSRPLISLVYGGGEFDDFSVQVTSTALFWLSLGMTGYAVQNILSRAYFARQDGRGPLVAGVLSIASNLLLCRLLTGPLGITGLALASALSSTLYALLLLVPLERRGEGVLDGAMVADLLRMLVAAGATGLSAWGVLRLLQGILPAGKLGELLSLALCALTGVAVYFLLTALFGVQEIRLVLAAVSQARRTSHREPPSHPETHSESEADPLPMTERAQMILDASFLCRGIRSLCNWISVQWSQSRVVHWFIHPQFWSREISESSIFFRIWSVFLGFLRLIYQKLSLNRVFDGSIFCQTWVWCVLPVVIAPAFCIWRDSLIIMMLCLVGYACLLLALVRDRKRNLMWSPINRYILLYGAVYLVGTFFSVSLKASLQPGLLTVGLLLYSLVVYSAVTRRKQLDVLINLVLAAALVVSVFGILQYIFRWGYQSAAWVDSDMFSTISFRAASTLDNPNMLGQYLILVIPLGGAKLLSSRDMKSRVGWLCACGIMCVCMILTMSRGAWLGLLFAGAAFFLFLNPRLILLAPFVLLALFFLLPETVTARFTSIGNLKDASTSYRVYIWMGTLAMLKDYWLCGIGPGDAAFNLVYPAYSLNAIIAPHSHNLFLQIVCDAGITALLIFLMLLFVYYRMMCTAISREKNRESRLLQIAFLSGVTGFLVQAMTDYSFYNYRLMFFFWAYLAMSALAARRDRLAQGGLLN